MGDLKGTDVTINFMETYMKGKANNTYENVLLNRLDENNDGRKNI